MVAMRWKAGRLTGAVIRSKVGGPCRIRYQDKVMELATEPGKTYNVFMNGAE